jgi:hypothetical protein
MRARVAAARARIAGGLRSGRGRRIAFLGAGATAALAALSVFLHAAGVRLPERSMAMLVAQGMGFVSLALYAGAFQLRSRGTRRSPSLRAMRPARCT